MLNRTGPGTDPWGTPLMIGCQLDLIPFTTTLWAWLSSQYLPSEVYTRPSREQPVSSGECCGKQCQRLY